MKKTLFLLSCIFTLLQNAFAQPIKTISQTELEYYLSRSIDGTIADLCKPGQNQNQYKGMAMYPSGVYNPYPNGEDYSGRNFARYNDMLRFITNVQPKFISNAISMWGLGWDDEWSYFINRAQAIVEDIKAIDNEIIVQAAPSEFFNEEIPNKTGNIPAWVFTAFGQPIQTRQFNMQSMMFDNVFNNPYNSAAWGDHWWDYGINTNTGYPVAIVPDISKLETQMYMYFLGRSFIDIGCESISFNQVTLMNGSSDPTNWNKVFSKLRQYADQQANVRYCLITGHTEGMKDDQDNLALDFCQAPVRPSEDLSIAVPYINNGGMCIIKSDHPCAKYNESLGGITPSGWRCAHSLVQRFLDNYGYPGPKYGVPGGTAHQPIHHCFDPYFWDEITWFALQPEEFRNEWLQYAYYKIRCLDPNAYFTLPMKRNISYGDGSPRYYANNANASVFFPPPPTINNIPGNYPDINLMTLTDHHGFSQENTIKDILASVNNSPDGWVYHNMTNEDLLSNSTPHNVLNDVIFVGTDKIFYAGDDKRIHGYIFENGSWVTVSPSYTAQNNYGQMVSAQAQFKGSLVASPDGSRLLYIGTDGLIHGFNINNSWDYYYFTFMDNAMQSQDLVAQYNLVYPTNDRIYYIAQENNGAGDLRIHGFIQQNGTWLTVGPPYSAASNFGQSVSSQIQPYYINALTYDNNTNRLYYIGSDFHIYYFEALNDWDYYYREAGINGGANLMTQQSLYAHCRKLAITGNTIYYIAEEGSGTHTVHALVDDGNYQWHTISPAYSAALYNGQPYNTQVKPLDFGEITVSPDGLTIAYMGEDENAYYYTDINSGWNFSYNRFKGLPSNGLCKNSLQFRNNNELFYNSYLLTNYQPHDGDIHVHRLEKVNCENAAIHLIEPGYQYKPFHSDSTLSPTIPDAILNDKILQATLLNPGSNNATTSVNTRASTSPILNNINSNTSTISIYPNPAKNILKIAFTGPLVKNYKAIITDVVGIKLLEERIDDNLSTLDISSFMHGIYIISVYDANNRLVTNQKISVQ